MATKSDFADPVDKTDAVEDVRFYSILAKTNYDELVNFEFTI